MKIITNAVSPLPKKKGTKKKKKKTFFQGARAELWVELAMV
jgi:hypothetical protein